MKKKYPLDLQSTAYHEAGHAVACIHEGVQLFTVSIAPDKDSAGHCLHRNILYNRHIDWDASTRHRLRMERLVRVGLAGLAAQRKFTKRGSRLWHGEDDLRKAMDVVSYFVGSDKELEAYMNLLDAQVQTFLMTPVVWEQIAALAIALLQETTIPAKRVRTIVRDASTQQYMEHVKQQRMTKAAQTKEG